MFRWGAEIDWEGNDNPHPLYFAGLSRNEDAGDEINVDVQ